MDKNKGIWIVIVAILIIGIAVTLTTSSFIKRNSSDLEMAASPQLSGTTAGSAPSQPYTEAPIATEAPVASKGRSRAAGAPSVSASPKMAAAKAEGGAAEESEASGASAPMKMAAAGRAEAPPDSPEMEMEERSAVAEAEAAPAAAAADAADSTLTPVISPLGPAEGNREKGAAEEKRIYYEKRLGDLDAQIQKMRSESSDSTTISMKTLAEKELLLWKSEMNTLYSKIMEALDDEAQKNLEEAQQAWQKLRDTKAEEAARKYSGGSLEGVEYTASQAESTRQRAYDLVDQYLDVLPAEVQ